MRDFLDLVYFNNSIEEYLIVLAIIVVSYIFLKAFKAIIIRKFKKVSAKTKTQGDDYLINGIDRFGVPIVQFTVIYWALHFLYLSVKAERIIDVSISIIITYFVLRLASSIILLLLESRIRKREHGEERLKQLGGLMIVINIIIWATGIIFLIDNLTDKDVSTILAGLGIGGIAIALAAQNILGDLFNYFVIYFDRPFEVGDFIVVDDKMGAVEYLGIKTTRIRSLSGEQIIIGNSNIAGARIHNFKRLANRRIVFSLNVDYRTPLEKVKMVPSILKSIVLEQKPVTFDRAHFATFGDWSLRFEVVYIVNDPDFNKYMDIQQAINLRIMEELKKNEIYLVTTPHFTFSPPPPVEPTKVTVVNE